MFEYFDPYDTSENVMTFDMQYHIVSVEFRAVYSFVKCIILFNI